MNRFGDAHCCCQTARSPPTIAIFVRCCHKLFNFGNWLIGMRRIGNNFASVSVHHQVKFFQHSLSYQHFVSENQRFLQRIPTENLE